MSAARLPSQDLIVALALAGLAALLVAGCGGGGGSASATGGKLNVVAVEDSWGSIAAQLGGEAVAVSSIVTNPAADPHDYEPTADDAKTMATAQVSIVNGIGYDEWASKLLAANPDSGRTELSVGEVLGLGSGDNPHQWYSPASVHEVIAAISGAYAKARPRERRYFERRRRAFETQGRAEYERLIAGIRQRYGGTPVGASESIFAALAPALGLRLVTPPGFMEAIAEGTEPTPTEKATADEQLEDDEIDLWVYNSQNTTPDVKRLNEAAAASGIPIATVTETTTPEGASFEGWMVRELRGVEAALGESGGAR
jgi:zinc/manganese transport system substrate-binding protein